MLIVQVKNRTEILQRKQYRTLDFAENAKDDCSSER